MLPLFLIEKEKKKEWDPFILVCTNEMPSLHFVFPKTASSTSSVLCNIISFELVASAYKLLQFSSKSTQCEFFYNLDPKLIG